MKIAFSLIALLPLAFMAASASAAQYYAADKLSDVIQGPQRSVAHKLRDKYRHPHATLEFFGLKPDMTVVELEPGPDGWYTEILAPYLHDHGRLIEAAPPLGSASKFEQHSAEAFRRKLKTDPSIYGKIRVVPFAPPKQVDLGPANSADMVLTFRNAHDWAGDGSLKAVFHAVYKVLKPGGVFGIVDHRANPGTDPLQDANQLSRLPEAYVINRAQQAGFKLAGVSQINANPADPRTMSIFLLPPTRAVAIDVEKDFDSLIDKSNTKHGKQMKAFIHGLQPVFDHIGESDCMTLRFVKPK